MKGTLTFLGTGTSQGIPMLGCNCNVCTSIDPKDKRLRTSALIKIENHNICIDAGPDFRYQLLREDCSSVDAIVFTHSHRDHIAGIDDVRAFNYINNMAMPIYATKEVISALKNDFSYIFEHNYPGIPKLDITEIGENPFSVFGKKMIPIPVTHYKMPVNGYRIGNLAYITDAKTISENSKKLITNLDTLIINCLHEREHVAHFNLKEVLAFIEEIKPTKTFLTHMSHLFGTHDEIIAKLPKGVLPAYDRLTIDFDYS